MSELKIIVDQALEELGGWDDAAVDRWSELSGVDVRAIDDNTPFDIDVANRLLATFPQVMEERKAPAAAAPEEPSPDEVISELSEIAEGLGEALGMSEEMKPEEVFPEGEAIPEVELETGVAGETGEEAVPAMEEPEAVPAGAGPVEETPPEAGADSSSIDALMRELETLAADMGVVSSAEKPGETLPEDAAAAISEVFGTAPPAEEPTPEEVEAIFPKPPVPEEVAPEPVAEEVATEPVAEEVVPEPVPEEIIPEPVPEEIIPEPVPEEIEPEPVEEKPVEIPKAVAEELAASARLISEIETPEFDLVALGERTPGFQAACVLRDGKVIARHTQRDVDWTGLAESLNALNSLFSDALGVKERVWEEMVVSTGNLFVLGFTVKGVQVVVVVKSERLGAARAWVAAALKDL